MFKRFSKLLGFCIASNYAPNLRDGIFTLGFWFITAVSAVCVRRFKGGSAADTVGFAVFLVLTLALFAYLQISIHSASR